MVCVYVYVCVHVYVCVVFGVVAPPQKNAKKMHRTKHNPVFNTHR